ncbi:DUF4097 family beta strand repeat-containing protein [Tsukamurella sp. 8F]|uniref:DUF4097 family beta strand repeat-containing protein n=1 Tax=unclassified Tsukamurella TaxID=2633480 RepID=UPI0023BA0D65|nr:MULTISPECIES: DUF4097 family beta strand repeat-containing protein [unclassified Tsukamurella]MDF0528412.1 DUF4097 family beta strand repeat-containing protein [Tsukamurella sp. 8J]MDF0586237.1 DUF4097 family beta strand repeat-containing protein [Tsukamurella sp. 8F]
MPVYATEEPVTVLLDLPAGDVRIVAGDRAEVTVDVRPGVRATPDDVKSVEEVQVRFVDGRLTIEAPRGWQRYWRMMRSTSVPAVEVGIEVPSGSAVQGRLDYGGIVTQGPLDRVDVDSDYGAIDIAEARAVRVDSNGAVRLGRVDGPAAVTNKYGATSVREALGSLQIKAAYGTVTVDRAEAATEVKTAYGAVHIGELVRGTAQVKSSYGDLDIGIRKGTAVWLDVGTQYGEARSELDEQDGPGDAADTLELQAHTTYGAIRVRRA